MAVSMNKSGDKGKEAVEITVRVKVTYPLTSLEDAKLQILDDVGDHFDKAARNITDDFDRAYVNDKGKLTCTERGADEKKKPAQDPEAELEDKDKKPPKVV